MLTGFPEQEQLYPAVCDLGEHQQHTESQALRDLRCQRRLDQPPDSRYVSPSNRPTFSPYDSTNMPLVPVYTITTTFEKPTVAVEGLTSDPAMSVISIDHLPSLLPREASDTFSNDLLPYLLTLKDWRSDPVWAGAEKLYKDKVATLPSN